jgi:hypothetical protein
MGKENKWIKYFVLKTERKVVLALLCSLLNTAVKYNPAGWGVPYNHVVFADSREVLVTLCLQVLLVLLDYRAPSNRVMANDSVPGRQQRGSVDTVRSGKESIPTTPTSNNLESNEAARVDNTPQDSTPATDATSTVTSSTQSAPKGHLPSHVDNAFRYYTSKLHRAQDFQFLTDGIYRILSNPMQVYFQKNILIF